jgi:hypothetical protein
MPAREKKSIIFAEAFMPRHATRTSFKKGRKAWNKQFDSVEERNDDYYIRNRRRILLKSRRYYIERRFGISVEEYDRKKRLQGNRCGFCGEPMGDPVLDHDPKTGKSRDFVHRSCNMLIGLARENPRIVQNIARYLKKHRAGKRGNEPL